MIDVKELRVGNYVSHEGVYKKILGIYSDAEAEHNSVTFDNNCYYDDMSLPSSGIEPIPLTPEILESAGFERIVLKSNIKTDCFFKPFENRYRKDCPFYIYANKNNDTGYFLSAEGFTTEILHVHQLQNIYFALTHKELSINLTSIHESR